MCSVVWVADRTRHFSSFNIVQSTRVCSCGCALSCSILWTFTWILHSGQEMWLEAWFIHCCCFLWSIPHGSFSTHGVNFSYWIKYPGTGTPPVLLGILLSYPLMDIFKQSQKPPFICFVPTIWPLSMVRDLHVVFANYRRR